MPSESPYTKPSLITTLSSFVCSTRCLCQIFLTVHVPSSLCLTSNKAPPPTVYPLETKKRSSATCTVCEALAVLLLLPSHLGSQSTLPVFGSLLLMVSSLTMTICSTPQNVATLGEL